MDKNIVIGIEGLVGTGKTTICKNLLNHIPNSIVLHAGNIYRAITYQIAQEQIPIEKLKSIDLKKLFNQFEIEIKIENKETVVFAHGKKITEEKLQSLENSLAVSKIAGIANNSNAYKIVEKYIDNYKQKYNVIFSGRDTKKIYPKLNYHIFLTADIDKRVEWKSSQYNQKRKEEIKENILKRDKLQKKAGYYETYNDTIIIDLSSSNSIEESTKQVLNHILEYKEIL
jgi:cytidylate kinase